MAQGAVLARELGRLPKMADWKDARRTRSVTVVGVAGLPAGRRQPGAWSAFQFLVRERLREEGVTVGPTAASKRGAEFKRPRRSRRAARGSSTPSSGARTAGSTLFAVRAVGRKRSSSRSGPRPRRSRRPFADLALEQAERGASPRRLRAPPGSTRKTPRDGRDRPRAGGRARGRDGVSPESRSSSQAAAMAPVSCSSDRGSLDRASASAKIASESTVISGSARSNPNRFEDLLVVDDDPLWMPTTAPWRIGWLLALDCSGGPSCSRARGRGRAGSRGTTTDSSSLLSRRFAACAPRRGQRSTGARTRRRRRRARRSRRAAPARPASAAPAIQARRYIPLCRTCRNFIVSVGCLRRDRAAEVGLDDVKTFRSSPGIPGCLKRGKR